jgi:hypothetical protein
MNYIHSQQCQYYCYLLCQFVFSSPPIGMVVLLRRTGEMKPWPFRLLWNNIFCLDSHLALRFFVLFYSCYDVNVLFKWLLLSGICGIQFPKLDVTSTESALFIFLPSSFKLVYLGRANITDLVLEPNKLICVFSVLLPHLYCSVSDLYCLFSIHYEI